MTTHQSGFAASRVIAKTVQWAVVGWSVFCGGSFVLALARLGQLQKTADEPVLGIGVAAGLLFWGGLWFVGFIAAELVAIVLFLSGPKAEPGTIAAREWGLAFLIAGVPNGLLALGLLVQLLRDTEKLQR